MKKAVALLEEKFPDEVVEVVEFRGDTTIEVKPERIVDIMHGPQRRPRHRLQVPVHDRRDGLFSRQPPVRRGL